jgi:hypothetical protein
MYASEMNQEMSVARNLRPVVMLVLGLSIAVASLLITSVTLNATPLAPMEMASVQ